jgi:hypothetical protein
MSTCNGLDLQTLGSHPIMPKNLPDHCTGYGVIYTTDLLNPSHKLCMQKPIYVSRSSESYLTTGCWSPTRPAVIYIGLIDGTIEIWDLLDHTHTASIIVTVSSCQLTSMEFWKLQCSYI